MSLKVKDTEQFKIYIRKSGKTSKDLAQSLGITDRYFSSVSNKKVSISKPLAKLIAYSLNVNENEIFLDNSV